MVLQELTVFTIICEERPFLELHVGTLTPIELRIRRIAVCKKVRGECFATELEATKLENVLQGFLPEVTLRDLSPSVRWSIHAASKALGASTPDQAKNLVALPSTHYIAKLLVRRLNKSEKHVCPNIPETLRCLFWIVKGA